MLNFVADPEMLKPLFPCGTELIYHSDETFLSVVGFMFLETRVLGLPIPLHRDFEEVNLRFYVRKARLMAGGAGLCLCVNLFRGVQSPLSRETFYGEPYSALPMRHVIEHKGRTSSAEYQWRRTIADWETLAMTARRRAAGSQARSRTRNSSPNITGATPRAAPKASEYQVNIRAGGYWPALTWKFEADVATLYGPRFVETLARRTGLGLHRRGVARRGAHARTSDPS